jgi:T5orf172 domain
MVYFILAHKTQRLKIGYSEDGKVDERFHYLRRDNADDLELLGRVPGDLEYETSLHAEIEPYRIHNEWFDWTAEEVKNLVAREIKWM